VNVDRPTALGGGAAAPQGLVAGLFSGIVLYLFSLQMEGFMYVLVFAGEVEETPTTMSANTVPTLDQAFARIMCRCGLSYRFTSWEQGWALEMTDVERQRSSRPASGENSGPFYLAIGNAKRVTHREIDSCATPEACMIPPKNNPIGRAPE
jgi:hypothetical protein